MPTPNPNGNPDSFFINWVRRKLRDQPAWIPETIPTTGTDGVANVAGAKPYRTQRAPVVASGVVLTAPGGGYAVVYDVAPAGGQVEIVSDTGEIIFNAAPPVGNLNITYQATRFSDTQILNALQDGMKAMYPQVWQLAQDTSLAPSSVLYEYTLPAAFADMRVVLMEVELRVPNIPVIPFKKYKRWKRVGPLALAFMDRFSPAGVIRLNYNAPYNALSDLEPIAMHLPCYYAMMLLLKEQEAMRTRATEMVPQTGEGGVKSGDAMATSRDWKDLFEAELERLGRPQPIRPDVPQEYEIFA